MENCNGIASMGPRLVSRGKADGIAGICIFGTLLQWGRDLLVAESRKGPLAMAIKDKASMGPRLVSRGKSDVY